MFTKKFTVIISFFLIIAIGVGGMLGYYDARLEAAVTPKKQSMDKVKIKNKEDLTFDKDVVNILLVGSDNGAQGSEKGDHGRSDSTGGAAGGGLRCRYPKGRCWHGAFV